MIRFVDVDPEPSNLYFMGFRTMYPTKEQRVEELKAQLNRNAAS